MTTEQKDYSPEQPVSGEKVLVEEVEEVDPDNFPNEELEEVDKPEEEESEDAEKLLEEASDIRLEERESFLAGLASTAKNKVSEWISTATGETSQQDSDLEEPKVAPEEAGGFLSNLKGKVGGLITAVGISVAGYAGFASANQEKPSQEVRVNDTENEPNYFVESEPSSDDLTSEQEGSSIASETEKDFSDQEITLEVSEGDAPLDMMDRFLEQTDEDVTNMMEGIDEGSSKDYIKRKLVEKSGIAEFDEETGEYDFNITLHPEDKVVFEPGDELDIFVIKEGSQERQGSREIEFETGSNILVETESGQDSFNNPELAETFSEVLNNQQDSIVEMITTDGDRYPVALKEAVRFSSSDDSDSGSETALALESKVDSLDLDLDKEKVEFVFDNKEGPYSEAQGAEEKGEEEAIIDLSKDDIADGGDLQRALSVANSVEPSRATKEGGIKTKLEDGSVMSIGELKPVNLLDDDLPEDLPDQLKENIRTIDRTIAELNREEKEEVTPEIDIDTGIDSEVEEMERNTFYSNLIKDLTADISGEVLSENNNIQLNYDLARKFGQMVASEGGDESITKEKSSPIRENLDWYAKLADRLEDSMSNDEIVNLSWAISNSVHNLDSKKLEAFASTAPGHHLRSSEDAEKFVDNLYVVPSHAEKETKTAKKATPEEQQQESDVFAEAEKLDKKTTKDLENLLSEEKEEVSMLVLSDEVKYDILSTALSKFFEKHETSSEEAQNLLEAMKTPGSMGDNFNKLVRQIVEESQEKNKDLTEVVKDNSKDIVSSLEQDFARNFVEKVVGASIKTSESAAISSSLAQDVAESAWKQLDSKSQDEIIVSALPNGDHKRKASGIKEQSENFGEVLKRIGEVKERLESRTKN